MNAKKAGQAIGTLLLLQVLIGMFIQFSVMGKLFVEPGFLLNGDKHALLIGASVMPMLLIGAFNLLIAAICYRQFNHTAPVFTLFFVALCASKLAMAASEAAHIMQLVSYSQHFVNAAGELRTTMESMATIVSSGRNWAHFLSVFMSGAILLCFYWLLNITSKVPKTLTLVAMSAAILQMIAVSQPFLGNPVIPYLLVPIGLTQILMPVYFIFKGIEAKAVEVGKA